MKECTYIRTHTHTYNNNNNNNNNKQICKSNLKKLIHIQANNI